MQESKFETVAVSLAGRNTDDGAYVKRYVYSIRQKKLLDIKRTERNEKGDRWDDIYFLLPGKYLLAEANVSSAGTHKCGYKCLNVFTREEYLDKKKREYPDIESEEFNGMYKDCGWEIRDWQGYIPGWAIVPCDCLKEEQEVVPDMSRKRY